jgi:CRISPR/Cas system CMR-associated protein Cmr5 small subunit
MAAKQRREWKQSINHEANLLSKARNKEHPSKTKEIVTRMKIRMRRARMNTFSSAIAMKMWSDWD